MLSLPSVSPIPADTDSAGARESNLPAVLTLTPLLAPPSVVHVKRSRSLARLIRARSDECYRNALTAMPYEPGSSYVEGTVVINDSSMPAVPCQHAWLEWGDGTVIDPTPGFAHNAGHCTYFATHSWGIFSIYALCIELRVARREWVPFPLASELEARERACYVGWHAELAAWRHAAALRAAASHPPLCDPAISERDQLVWIFGARWVEDAMRQSW